MKMEKNQQKTYIHSTFLLYIYIYIYIRFCSGNEKKKKIAMKAYSFISEPGFDPGTCGLWAHHASAAPLWLVDMYFFSFVFIHFFFLNARLSWAFGLLMIFRLNNTKPIFVLFCGSNERHGLLFFFFCAQIKEKQLLICL